MLGSWRIIGLVWVVTTFRIFVWIIVFAVFLIIIFLLGIRDGIGVRIDNPPGLIFAFWCAEAFSLPILTILLFKVAFLWGEFFYTHSGNNSVGGK